MRNLKLDNYNLTLLLGMKGSGKTSYLCKVADSFGKRGFKIYSNVQLPYAALFDIKKLCDPFVPEPESIVIIDEAGIELDNRSFKSFTKGQLAFFKLQRHLKVKVILASQDLDFDKKVKRLLDQIIYIKRVFPHFSFSRPLVPYLHVIEDPQGDDGEANILFAYKWKSIFQIRAYFLPLYWGKYDSFSLEQLPSTAKLPESQMREQSGSHDNPEVHDDLQPSRAETPLS